MSNELLEAIKNNDDSTLTSLLRYNSLETIKEQILDLLALQRQECAEKAEVENEGTYGSSGEVIDYYIVDKQSILKATIL